MKPWISDNGSTGESKNNLSSIRLFGKDNPWRPVYVAWLLFLGIGYAFYLAACFLPTPQWGRELISGVLSGIGALSTAARVAAIQGNDPFPVQVVILFCVCGAIAMASWYGYWNIRNHIGRNTLLLNH